MTYDTIGKATEVPERQLNESQVGVSATCSLNYV